MSTIDLVEGEYKDAVSSNDFVIVEFWAQWCRPCRTFKRVFESASDSHEDVLFARVDAESQSHLADELDIRSIPAVSIYRDGILIHCQTGAMPADYFEELISRASEVDMGTVRDLEDLRKANPKFKKPATYLEQLAPITRKKPRLGEPAGPVEAIDGRHILIENEDGGVFFGYPPKHK